MADTGDTLTNKPPVMAHMTTINILRVYFGILRLYDPLFLLKIVANIPS